MTSTPSAPETLFIRSLRAQPKTIGSDLAVYIPENKSIHVLNPTARLIFELLSETMTADELSTALAEATDGDRETIADDVSVALEEFVTKGIVETRHP